MHCSLQSWLTGLPTKIKDADLLMTPPDSKPDAADWRVRYFEKSVPDRERLRQLRQVLSSAGNGNFLDVAVGDGAHSLLLRRLPGRWTTVALDPRLAEELRAVLPPETVLDLNDAALPFPDQIFDFVVLPDVLPAVQDDYGFIRECHRVLKTKAYLLCTVPNIKSWSLVRGIRRLLGLSDLKAGFVRPGYTERELYDLFKDGYDIVESHTWSRFFVETGHAITQVVVGAALSGARTTSSVPSDQAAVRRGYTLLSIARPFVLLGAALDRLIRFTRGHQRIALIKTRMWIPRREVKIRDGRSIADATINTRIGTAGEF
jgi:SAM-dependent methyltransferase